MALARSFVEFQPPDQADEFILLTDESAQSLSDRITDPNTINFGGTKVHGVGWNIADYLPDGLAGDQLKAVAHDLSEQIGCSTVAASMIIEYEKRMEKVL